MGVGRTIIVAAKFVGGPMDGQHQIVLAEAKEIPVFKANMEPAVMGEAAIYEGRMLPTDKGVYAWDGYSANPRRYHWMGWQ